jgi:sarcosine oxidase
MHPVPARRHRSDTEHRSHIVVGAGILGLAAARSLSRRGHDVLVLDAATPGHERSGSKGSARIFRLSYPDSFFVRLAQRAQALWRSLESESGRSLFEVTGQVNFGRDLHVIADAMTQAGSPFQRLSPAAAEAQFPLLRIDGPALFEESSGVLVADECLMALCETGSFELRPNVDVLALHDRADVVHVELADGQILTADVAVNCAGPGALALLEQAPPPIGTLPSLQQVIYLATQDTEHPIPLFIEWGDDMIYGLPVPGTRTLKLSHHARGPEVSDLAAPRDNDPQLVEALVEVATRLLPMFDPTPVVAERCVYDNTIDSDFIVDRVGRVVIGCGTSGHGFKFGPLLGDLLADLATGETPPIDLGRFALRRSFLRALPDP